MTPEPLLTPRQAGRELDRWERAVVYAIMEAIRLRRERERRRTIAAVKDEAA